MSTNQFAPITEEDVNLAYEDLASARPTMEPEPEVTLSLPGGYRDPISGEIHRSVEVREMNGKDEETISAASRSKNYIDFLDKILVNNVTSIGGQETTKEMVQSLTSGDRQYLLMCIRQATFGDKLELDWGCLECGSRNDVSILISDIPVIKVEDTVFKVNVEVGNGKPDAEVSLRLVTGSDSWAMNDRGVEDTAVMNTFILSRCILRWNDVPILDMASSAEKFVLDMPLRIRRQLLKALADNQPGPNYSEVKASCHQCGQESPIRLDMASLLLG